MKYENPLAQNLFESVQRINFGENRIIKPVKTEEALGDLSNTGLGLDYRAVTEEIPGYKTVFDGLAFDKEAVRTQCFSVYEEESPIAIMSIAITPKSWIEQQRYLQLDKNNLIAKVIDYKSAINESETPEFFIVPAWTKTIESHRNKLAIPGFKAIKNIFEILQNEAPQNTHMEVIAQGQFLNKDDLFLKDILSKSVGTDIDVSQLPFSKEIIGQHSSGSSSTVKMARLLNLQQINRIGALPTLGPVFYKKVK